MKLLCVLTLLLLGAQVQRSECRISWSAGNLVESVGNRTGQLAGYVRETSRSLGRALHGYYDGARRAPGEMYRYVSDEQKRLTKKFGDYIESVRRPGGGGGGGDGVKPARRTQCTGESPEVHMTTPQLIALHGYPAESHTVRTEDGYLLTAHRIPRSRYRRYPAAARSPVVLLHHGLLGSSADWVLAGPGQALAYILSDTGFDVWMANVRGNVYSKAHVSLHTDSYDFWNFTWHDVAQHDLPALIDYIHDVKGNGTKIYYIGHSMGTTVLFALLSTRPEYNSRLNAGFALAPVAYMSDIRSPVRLLAPYAHDIDFLIKLLGANEFLPQNSVMRWLSKHACEINSYEEAICENSFFVLCGHDRAQFNSSLLPIILAHVPAGASTKTLVHYAQEIRAGGEFQQFDYGEKGNLARYGSARPPAYPLEKVSLPVGLLSARNDWLAGEVDVQALFARLPRALEHYVVPLDEFNHIDFLWAVDAPELVYVKLIKMLRSVDAI